MRSTPELHAGREWAYVEVAPAHRGRGLGEQALHELRRGLPSTAAALRGKVRAGSAAQRFANKHGIEPLHQTRLVEVVAPLEPDAPAKRRAVALPDEAVDDASVRAWAEYYTAGHDWDPPGALPITLCRELFFTTPAHLVVVASEDSSVGIVLVGAIGDDTSFTGGVVGRRDAHAVEIASALVSAAASMIGDESLVVELDDWTCEVAEAIEPPTHHVVDEAFVMCEATNESHEPGPSPVRPR